MFFIETILRKSPVVTRLRNKPNRKSKSFNDGQISNRKLTPYAAIRTAVSTENLATKGSSDLSNHSTPKSMRSRSPASSKSSKPNIPLTFSQFNADNKVFGTSSNLTDSITQGNSEEHDLSNSSNIAIRVNKPSISDDSKCQPPPPW